MKKLNKVLRAALLTCCTGFTGVVVMPASIAAAETVQSAPIVATERINGTVLTDSVIELPTLTHVDFDAVLAADSAMMDRKMGCSAVAKIFDNG